ncbi:MAG: L-glutamate gamma-semialdehyde dehydrogenase [Candidatus Marinimicrobia bacterium]|nr:L-glutamate gamma-semialdehyde dehydrogenase [Candidatus Neomarinimicrobiota bacterium]
MINALYKIPHAENERVLSYAPGTPERASVKKMLNEMMGKKIEIPVIIGGKEIYTGKTADVVCPHDHQHVLGTYHIAGDKEIRMAIDAALEAREEWASMPAESRAAIFKKMAVLLAKPYGDLINASTMLGQSKTIYQAEIDAACELIDFYNFNTHYMSEIYKNQPDYSPTGVWNQLEYRPLEGFVFALTPFNFTSIAGNLPTSPALMGNTVVWKPSRTQLYSAYFLMKLFKEAGLPDGVINFLPGSGKQIGDIVLPHPDLAGIHFTGSTKVFQHIWKTIGENIHNYKSYPRIVGETGGKDFIFAHKTADVDALVVAMVRGAFEFQGQKCSAASRVYMSDNIWDEVKEKYVAMVKTIKMGSPLDFTNFMTAVIDEAAFDKITEYINYAKAHKDAEIITGGGYDKSKGYFIEPTTIVTTDPKFKSMEEEIFGPVLTIYVYKADEFEATLELCDQTSPYALTGAIFAQDRTAVTLAKDKLVNAAGNFYINDKPTGAVVGQQPFGGARASGTNDKAGSSINLMRWVSVRTIKETFNPPKAYEYPFMDDE